MGNSFTSESVCSGHPDKICDQVSDAIVDSALSQDPFSRVAVETLVTKNFVCIAGEVTTKGVMPYKKIVQKVLKELDYDDERLNFTYKSPILSHIHTQSSEIAVGVDDMGAGDQGMMFGFACNETKNFMPLPIELAHKLTKQIDLVRKSTLKYLRPDGKAQVTIEYKKYQPIGVQYLVLAVPHDPKVKLNQVKHDLYTYVVKPVLDRYGYTFPEKNIVVNGTGVWHIGGPASDTGVTGRKIIVDTYGGMARVGGGCFSGKDATKVDRSAAYAARYLAKNIVAQKLADRCEVRLAYFIGAKKPVMQEVETYGTEKKSHVFIQSFMEKILDTSVKNIINKLDLRKPIFQNTAAYGHFGRNEFSWEKIKHV